MKKICLLSCVILLVVVMILSVSLYRINQKNNMLDLKLEKAYLYELESRIWQEYHRNIDDDYFLNLFHGSEFENGKLILYFYLPTEKDAEKLSTDIKDIFSGDEEKIDIRFYDIEKIHFFREDLTKKIKDEGIYTLISGINESNGIITFWTNENWLLRLLNLAKQYSYENNIMIDVRQGEYRPN